MIYSDVENTNAEAVGSSEFEVIEQEMASHSNSFTAVALARLKVGGRANNYLQRVFYNADIKISTKTM